MINIFDEITKLLIPLSFKLKGIIMTNKKRSKQYIPPKRHNPEVMATRIEQQQRKVDDVHNVLDAVVKANEQHIIFLSNFIQHDIKNAIHCMDGILSTTSADKITEDDIISLKTSLDSFRQTLSNFADVIPHSQNGEFLLVNLLSSVESLSRNNLNKNKIECVYNYDRQSNILINQSFQALLQILHNIVINASKSLENSPIKKIIISALINNKSCEIRIADTGEPILPENKEKIFSYGFSTTGGTGIGLFHAKYVCNSFGGSISVNTECQSPVTKEFIINFTIKKHE
jgi:signal transduction histidine kinase